MSLDIAPAQEEQEVQAAGEEEVEGRLEICQKIYTTKFSGERILHIQSGRLYHEQQIRIPPGSNCQSCGHQSEQGEDHGWVAVGDRCGGRRSSRRGTS